MPTTPSSCCRQAAPAYCAVEARGPGTPRTERAGRTIDDASEQNRRVDPQTALELIKWGLRIGLKVRELRALVSEIDRFAAAHVVSPRQALEWVGAARGAPGGRIFIAGDRDTVGVANPEVRTIAQRALVNQARWPHSRVLSQWLEARPESSP